MDFDFQKARNSLRQLNNNVAQILVYAQLMQLSLTGDKEKERVKLVIAGALECRQIEASLMNDMLIDFQKARNSLHQLNNKVAQILAYAELMQLSLTSDKEKERIKLVIAGALECRQITASLMNDMPKSTPSIEN